MMDPASQSHTIGSKRSSLEARSPEDRESDEEERCHPNPPSKIQKTVFANKKKPYGLSRDVLDCYFTTVYGFAPNEFLPLCGATHPSSTSRASLDSSLIAKTLCDDALGHCLFSGFLDTFETVQVSTSSRRLAAVASKHVHRLDVSRCPNLTVSDVKSLVRRYPHLKVRYFWLPYGCCLSIYLPYRRYLIHRKRIPHSMHCHFFFPNNRNSTLIIVRNLERTTCRH